MKKVIEELRKHYGMNSRVGKVTCKGCGCSLEVPNMYSEKSRKVLQPYCPSTVMLHIQWLLHHGWHITKHEANPLQTFFCPNCFPDGQSEYKQFHEFDPWIEQASKWMKENDGKQ